MEDSNIVKTCIRCNEALTELLFTGYCSQCDWDEANTEEGGYVEGVD